MSMRNVLFTVLLTIGHVAQAETVELTFDIYPPVGESFCGDLYEDEGHSGYTKLLRNGWVTVDYVTYSAESEHRKCKQAVRVRFPSEQEYYDHLEWLHGCIQYPFIGSGADHYLFLEAALRSVRLSDLGAYRVLIAKDPGGCVSELNDDLFAELKPNITTFLSAFSELDEEEKWIAVQNQPGPKYSQGNLKNLSSELQHAARKYNELIKAQASQSLISMKEARDRRWRSRNLYAGFSAPQSCVLYANNDYDIPLPKVRCKYFSERPRAQCGKGLITGNYKSRVWISYPDVMCDSETIRPELSKSYLLTGQD